MTIKHVLATAGAALAMAGMTATSAHADFDLTGGDFMGSSSVQQTIVVGGGYTIACDASFAGNTENVPGDPSSTMVVPTFTNCEEFSRAFL